MLNSRLMQKTVSASGVAKPFAFLSQVSRQGRNYSTLILWLLHSVFNRRTSKLAIAIALSLVGLACQGAAIALIYWYGRGMEESGLGKIPVLNWSIDLKDQPQLLWLIVATSTLCFVLSGGLVYFSRKLILDLVERHFANSIDQMVMFSLRLPDPRVSLASNLLKEYGVGGLSTGCRRSALIAVSFAITITAVIGAAGAAIFLFRVTFSLTLIILIAMALAALLLYPLTLRAVKSAKDREKARTVFKEEVRALAENRSAPPPEGLKASSELARAFIMRRRVLTELVFAMEIGITAILGLVVYYMASEALAGKEQWAIFISYIAALRLTLNGAAQAIRAFASVSRYYPQIVRYYLFAKDMQKIDASGFGAVHGGETLILGTLPNGVDVTVEVGNWVATVTFDSMRSLRYALLNARQRHSKAPLASVVFDPATGVPRDAAIVLIDSSQLKSQEIDVQALRDALKDKVTLAVYSGVENVGVFGETVLLTIRKDEMQRFAPIGSGEAGAALKEAALKVREKRLTKGLFDEDDDDDDE
jgi:hypothetical protein